MVCCDEKNHLILFFEGHLTNAVHTLIFTDYLPGMLQDIYIRGIHFQYDGAGPHFGTQVRNYPDSTYPNRWIDRGGPV